MTLIGYEQNEYGTKLSRHKCDVCNEEFTLCPAMPEGKDDTCGAPECASYDQARDAEVLFMTDKQIAASGKPVHIDMLRARKNGIFTENKE